LRCYLAPQGQQGTSLVLLYMVIPVIIIIPQIKSIYPVVNCLLAGHNPTGAWLMPQCAWCLDGSRTLNGLWMEGPEDSRELVSACTTHRMKARMSHDTRQTLCVSMYGKAYVCHTQGLVTHGSVRHLMKACVTSWERAPHTLPRLCYTLHRLW